MKTFRKLYSLLTPKEHKSAILLLLMIIIMSFFEMLGVASILPFMAVLSNPGLIETNLFLNLMYKYSNILGVENNQDFLFVLGSIVFVLLIISLFLKALTTYIQVRFVQMCEYSISKRLIEGYLYQAYSWFLSRNSADLGKTILSEVQQLILNGINPLMHLIAKVMVVIALIILLIVVDPEIAVMVGFTLSLSYGIIFYFLRKYLKKIGGERLTNNKIRFTAVNEAFGAAKEIKVGGFEENYINSFSKSAKIFANTQALSQAAAQLPRFFLEAIAFGGILLIMIYMISQKGNFNSVLPLLSLYAFAGYRLIPALQHVYAAFIQLTFIGPSIDKLNDDLKNLKPADRTKEHRILSLNKNINLNNVNFNYPNTERVSLKNINLNIKAKSTIGLVGATGSGKTTLVDIILGLLNPQKGTLEVDGIIITKQNLRSWQKSIGYVPQNIFLADDTVEANIAFGVNRNNINFDDIQKASKIANLHEFVMTELSEKYKTIIGERGVRLSGGQRQRIGIARALYRNPEILVLDESTSALDNLTERQVMESINNLRKEITIIIIAHRLSTVKNCDKIYLLEKGELKNHGTFEELMNIDANFRMNANS